MAVWGRVALAVALALGAGFARADSYDDELAAIRKASAAHDCAAALTQLRRFVAEPRFAEAAPALALAAWDYAANCAVQAHDYEEAFADVRHATEYADARDGLWTLRINLAGALKRWADVADSADIAARNRPLALKALPLNFVEVIRVGMRHDGREDLRTRFADDLASANYAPPDPFDNADGLWKDQADAAAARGDAPGVAAAIGRMRAWRPLVELRLDARFASVVAADPARFDIPAAAGRQLAADRAAAADHPELLSGVLAVSSDLLALGRAGEAQPLLASAQARIAAQGPAAFKDFAIKRNWFDYGRARVLLALGRFDDAELALRAAMVRRPGDYSFLDAAVALARLQSDRGRPADALDTLAALGSDPYLNDYGRMVLRATRVCALGRLGRAAEAAADLAALKANARDGDGPLTDALLCAGDLDGVADLTIRRLADPDRRGDALWDLSVFDHATPPPGRAERAARLAQVRDRADVRAAVDKVGHTGAFALTVVDF